MPPAACGFSVLFEDEFVAVGGDNGEALKEVGQNSGGAGG